MILLPAGQASAQGVSSLPGQFAYVEDGFRLYLVRGNVEEPVLLLQTEGGFVVQNPRFSRDGRYLAYCVHHPAEEQFTRLFFLDTQTLVKVMVTDEASCSFDWWIDGKTLAFSTSLTPTPAKASDQGIWSYTLETGALEPMVHTDTPVIDPRWSPDGRTLSYYDYCAGCVGQFHTYDLITKVTMDWSQDGTDRTIGPDMDWSPDGKALAFDEAAGTSAGQGESFGIETASSDAETWREVYSQPGRDVFFPIWSPDGQKIAFASFQSFIIGTYVNRRADLMTVSPDGSGAQMIYSSTYEVLPQAWSPDGRYMLVVEPLSVITQGYSQRQQLVLVDMQTGSALWKISSYNTLTAAWAPIPAVPDAQAVPPTPMAGKSGLLFIQPDESLAFYEPLSGQEQTLTASFTGREFSLSPDGKTVLIGDQILSFQAQADGSVSNSTIETTLPAEYSRLRWSPDGQRFGYVDTDNSAWVVDVKGNREQLTEGESPPGWSYDGQWMAYCDRQGRLWIARTGKPADWIIQKDQCSLLWSPTQPILAYITHPPANPQDPAGGTAFLYDPVSGRTREIAQAVSSLAWSPDGRLVSINRITTIRAESDGYSVTAVNPDTGAELFIDNYSPDSYANSTWIEQEDGYLFGRYRFQADLLAKEAVADILFDATPDGNRLLAGSGGPDSISIFCRDVGTNTTYPLVDVTLIDTPGTAMPGLRGEFSPDGTWILIGDYQVDRTVNWLAQCDGSAPVQLSKNVEVFDQYFSPESDWLVTEDTHSQREMIPQILLQDLETGSIREMQAGLHTDSTWLQMPQAPTAPPSTGTTTAAPAASPAPSSSSLIDLQSDLPDNYDRLAMISILLWAGALIAIVLLMLSLWRRSPPPLKQEPPVETQATPVPEPEAHPAPGEVKAAFQQGVDLIHAGKAREGILELRRVIAAEPGNNVAWFWLGIASVRQEDYRTAERCFLQAKRHGHPQADQVLEWLKKQK